MSSSVPVEVLQHILTPTIYGELRIRESLLEGEWLGITLERADIDRQTLNHVWEILSDSLSHLQIELRSGNTIGQGGNGFGPNRHLVAVLGGKGGVGKSTIAVNLALTLSAMGQKVGILDGDINAPDVHHLLGLAPQASHEDREWELWRSSILPPSRRRSPVRRYLLDIVSIGLEFHEKAAPSISGREMIAALFRHLAFETRWDSEIVIVDVPPGSGNEVQMMLRHLPISGAVLVTTPQDLAQMDAGRTVTLLQQVGVPVVGLVQNMAWLTCPHCDEVIELYRHSSRLEDLGIPVLARIPFDIALSSGADRGVPLVLNDRTRIVSREFAGLGRHVLDSLTNEERSPERRTQEP